MESSITSGRLAGPAASAVTVNGGAPREALLLHVRGVVQGVGFRPFVHRLALRHALGGWVRNESGEVRIEVEGEPDSVRRFLVELRKEAPPLARIDVVEAVVTRPRRVTEFRVIESVADAVGRLPVSPDVSLCDACRSELRDPSNRRYMYPFITCTDCGPRYTVIESMPYDRERTSMRLFSQCDRCRLEYRSPADRRYHSETNSCPECGPRVWLESAAPGGFVPAGGRRINGQSAIEEAARRLSAGQIIALRGLGGFHLAVDATSELAVQRLRRRKAREAKPLAVMVAAVDDALVLGVAGTAEQALLQCAERPIVLLRARPGNGLAPSISPGLDTVGVVLAYTPLHLLLLDRVRRPLVMTSGNMSEEPIVTSNSEAADRLGPVADALLLHDREIVSRYDDSVVRVAAGERIMLRRARGHAPLPIALPVHAPEPLVAVGPHLKNTFALAHGEWAWVSQHIGDLENIETLEHFRTSLERFRRLFRIEPTVAVRDAHPGYLSSRLADELGLGRVISVQHHHAHVAAVAAEHGITTPVVGLAFDGTGYGEDGCVWGAETLIADLRAFRRVGRLRYAPLPGGDLATRRPWRAALGYLSLEPDAAGSFAFAFADVSERECAMANAQIMRRLNAPLASSMGRLFDAAAAVLGLRHVAHYEGQAAMELESLAGSRAAEPLPFPVARIDGTWVMDPLPLLAALGDRVLAGDTVADLAARFHESVAATAADLAARVADEHRIDAVALAGGVFQNARLLTRVRSRLEERGLCVLLPRQLGPNDGAISYGQAAVAAAILSARPGE